MDSKPIAVKNITKIFGDFIANNNITFEAVPHEIHCILGENGAGKSTFMNILSGVYTPDSGSIFIGTEEVNFRTPKDSIEKGIGMIYQHFKLVEVMTALQNVLLGNKEKFFFNGKEKEKEIQKIIDKYGLDVKLDKYVYDMSVGEKENLEILKVLYRGARILILDEPTAVFTPQETQKLFSIMEKMKENGCVIIFITHKMNEVMEVADRITILRKGENVCTIDKKDADPKKLIELMMGRKVDLSINNVKVEKGKEILKVQDLCIKDNNNIDMIKKVSFSINAGEILGIAGITGCGQKELCEAIAGITRVDSGKVIFEGKDITKKTSVALAKEGTKISYIPEDRLGMGLVGSMGISDNMLLKTYKKQKNLLLDRKQSQKEAERVVKEFEVKTTGIEKPIRYMSGGNLQKVLLGRELSLNPKLLIMAYPVRGLDVNTCYTIYDIIMQEKKKGTAILFIGEDLDVLMKLSDRIAVLYSGEIMGICEADKTTKEEIGFMMLGNNGKGDEKYEDAIN